MWNGSRTKGDFRTSRSDGSIHFIAISFIGEEELKPPAFIQMDLDGVWAIRKCYGLPEDQFLENDPVYEEGVPRFLDLLQARKIPASFFVVGRDAKIPKKVQTICRILKAGHEIGNHSNEHTLGLTKLSVEEIKKDITEAQNAISGAVKQSGFGAEHRPVGFRAPGYDADSRVLKILGDLGFLYDASLFPSWWGFVMRRIDSYLSGPFARKKRQYGSFKGGFESLKPHPIKQVSGLYELPVSVSPVFRLPFHFGIAAMRGFDYFRRAAQAYRKRNIPLLYLFHGIDFVETRGLALLPSTRGAVFFKIPIEQKTLLAEKILDFIRDNFEILRARDWVEAILKYKS